MPERVVLGRDEARVLHAIARRQAGWEPRMPVRLRAAGPGLGVVTTPPLDVLVMIAVPVIEPVASLDRIVRIADLVRGLEPLLEAGGVLDAGGLEEVRVAAGAGMSVAELPPSDGWHLPINAVAGDILVPVQQAVAEFRRRAAGQAPAVQQQIADEIWNATGWATLPMRVLHAAQLLGLLRDDRSRISAAVNGSWKRLTTARGHVLVHERAAGRLLPLDVIG